MRHALAFGPHTAPPQTELRSKWKASAKLDDAATISVDLDSRNPAASQIQELIDDFWLYWDGQPLLRGRVGPTSDTIDDTPTCSFSAGSYRGLLARRLVYDDWDLLDTNIDPIDALWNLIQQTQAEPGGAMGITRGVQPPDTLVQTIKHVPGQYLTEAAAELVKFAPGFQWDISPDLKFDAWRSRRGRVVGDTLYYGGKGAIVSGQRNVDPAEFANALRQSSGQEGVAGTTLAATDIAGRPEGRWDMQLSGEGLTTTAATAARAAEELVERNQIQPSYTLKLRRGFWEGPEHLWLGDTVGLRIKNGRISVGTDLPIVAIDLEAFDTGAVDVSLTLGTYSYKQRREMRLWQVDRRLVALERR